MKKLVLVDTVSQFRIRYVVEVEDDIKHALDEVIVRKDDVDFMDFSQEHLGETVVSYREINYEEYIKIFDEDNKYLASWEPGEKFKYINVIDYGEKDDSTTNSSD